MSVIFGFTMGGCLLGHSIRLHIECNTKNNWYSSHFEFDEVGNGFHLITSLLKTEIYLSVLSNCNDFYHQSSTDYFLQQSEEEMLEESGLIEGVEEYE